ncbi:putative membrane protein [Luteibacter sp. HA06]|jgi:uncharacterized membrane protein
MIGTGLKTGVKRMPHQDQQVERLTFFSDAVFAIAMTLLVIDIKVPEPAVNTDEAWVQALANLIPHFVGFILTFYVVGALWAAHHRTFGRLRHYDPAIVWPNLTLLMVVAFIPFPTALMSTHFTDRVPQMFYALTLLVAGLCQYRLIRRTLRPPYLYADVTADDVTVATRRSLGMPCMALLAIVIAIWWPGLSNIPLMITPLFIVLLVRMRKVPAATVPPEPS